MGLRARSAKERRNKVAQQVVDKVERRKHREGTTVLRKPKRSVLEKRSVAAPTAIPSAAELMVLGVNSSEHNAQLEATREFRKLLSSTDPPIQEVIKAGVVPRFVDFLQRSDDTTIQFESAWVLTNIASGTHEHTRHVVECNALPPLISLLSSPKEEVREQVIWAIGNICGDGAEMRNLVLSHGALEPLLKAIYQAADSEKVSILQNGTWTLSNLCRGKPKPVMESISPAIPTLALMLNCKDEAVSLDAAWAFSYLSDGSDDCIQQVVDAGICPRVVELLREESLLTTPALRTVGNIVTGNEAQTQCAVDAGCLPLFQKLLHSSKGGTRKEACWGVSNVTAGSVPQIQVRSAMYASLQLLRSPPSPPPP